MNVEFGHVDGEERHGNQRALAVLSNRTSSAIKCQDEILEKHSESTQKFRHGCFGLQIDSRNAPHGQTSEGYAEHRGNSVAHNADQQKTERGTHRSSGFLLRFRRLRELGGRFSMSRSHARSTWRPINNDTKHMNPPRTKDDSSGKKFCVGCITALAGPSAAPQRGMRGECGSMNCCSDMDSNRSPHNRDYASLISRRRRPSLDEQRQNWAMQTTTAIVRSHESATRCNYYMNDYNRNSHHLPCRTDCMPTRRSATRNHASIERSETSDCDLCTAYPADKGPHVEVCDGGGMGGECGRQSANAVVPQLTRVRDSSKRLRGHSMSSTAVLAAKKSYFLEPPQSLRVGSGDGRCLSFDSENLSVGSTVVFGRTELRFTKHLSAHARCQFQVWEAELLNDVYTAADIGCPPKLFGLENIFTGSDSSDKIGATRGAEGNESKAFNTAHVYPAMRAGTHVALKFVNIDLDGGCLPPGATARNKLSRLRYKTQSLTTEGRNLREIAKSIKSKMLGNDVLASQSRGGKTRISNLPTPDYYWTGAARLFNKSSNADSEEKGQRTLAVAMEVISGRPLTRLLSHLSANTTASTALLTLEVALKIVSAQRLLAEQCNTPIINWDTKPGNILLEFSRSLATGRLHCRRAVIVDVGDALPGPVYYFPTKRTNTTACNKSAPGYIICTKGFAAPECAVLVFLLSSTPRCTSFRRTWYGVEPEDHSAIERLMASRKFRIQKVWKELLTTGALRAISLRVPTGVSACSTTVASTMDPVTATSTTVSGGGPPTPSVFCNKKKKERGTNGPSAWGDGGSNKSSRPIGLAPCKDPCDIGKWNSWVWEVEFSHATVVFSTGLVLAQLFGSRGIMHLVQKDEKRAIDSLCEWDCRQHYYQESAISDLISLLDGCHNSEYDETCEPPSPITYNSYSNTPNLAPKDLLPHSGIFSTEPWRSRVSSILKGCLQFVPKMRLTFVQLEENLKEFITDFYAHCVAQKQFKTQKATDVNTTVHYASTNGHPMRLNHCVHSMGQQEMITQCKTRRAGGMRKQRDSTSFNCNSTLKEAQPSQMHISTTTPPNLCRCESCMVHKPDRRRERQDSAKLARARSKHIYRNTLNSFHLNYQNRNQNPPLITTPSQCQRQKEAAHQFLGKSHCSTYFLSVAGRERKDSPIDKFGAHEYSASRTVAPNNGKTCDTGFLENHMPTVANENIWTANTANDPYRDVTTNRTTLQERCMSSNTKWTSRHSVGRRSDISVNPLNLTNELRQDPPQPDYFPFPNLPQINPSAANCGLFRPHHTNSTSYYSHV